MSKETDILNSLYENISMGENAVKKVLPKVKDNALKSELQREFRDYKNQCNNISAQLKAENHKPSGAGWWTKAMSSAGIALNCARDSSSQHIAEMMIQGTNMGVIKINKALNAASDASPKVVQEAKNILENQQKYIDNLKAYL
jgi:hypothetical protein